MIEQSRIIKVLFDFCRVNKKQRKKILVEFGQRVKQLRKDQNITQDQLAFESELSREEISRIEGGKKNVALETNLALAIGFGITLKELFDFEYDYGQQVTTYSVPDSYKVNNKAIINQITKQWK